MQKKYRNGAIVAGAVLIAAGVYTKTPLMNAFSLSAQANDAEDAASSNQESGNTSNQNSGNNEVAKKAQEVQQESAKKAQEVQQESIRKTQEIQQESVKRAVEIQQESIKKTNEIQSESAKKKLEITKRAQGQGIETSNNNQDQPTDHNTSGVENDNNGDNANEDTASAGDVNQVVGSDVNERLKHTNEKIAEAEKYILEQQSEGKDVTIALARLAQAKNMLQTADASLLDTKGKNESDDLVKEALKLTHTAQGDDVHNINDADKFIKKASERINQASEKLSRLSASGVDTKTYQSMIDTANADLKSAQDAILQGSLLDGATLAQKSESEAKSAKKAIESALLSLGLEDDELSGDHKSVVAKAVEDLLFVANVEGDNSVGTKVREIAREQRDSADKVDTLIDDAQSRSGFSEFVLGPKYKDLSGIQKQVTDNTTRIQSLGQVKSQLTDTDLQGVVQEHIDALTEENTKLQSFVSGKETHKGIFGWFFRLLQ